MKLLEDKGWKCYYTCNNCKGKGPLQYWNNPAFPGKEIRIRTRRNTFSIYSSNQKIYGPDWAYQLEGAMKKFEIYEVV